MYIDPEGGAGAPSTNSALLLIKSADLNVRPKRRAIFFAPKAKWEDRFDPEQSGLSETMNMFQLNLGIDKVSSSTQRQKNFYGEALSLLTNKDLRPSDGKEDEENNDLPMKWTRLFWHIHFLKDDEGRKLRCDWYHERVRWKGSEIDELSLSYVFAKRIVSEQLGRDIGLPLSEYGPDQDSEWLPLLKTPSYGATPEHRITPIVRKANSEDIHLYVRILEDTIKVSAQVARSILLPQK
mmetsp:Transcript_16508/g.24040  ORF Transcript_16508/g.24040 Transcript_16508/m.24040 type:complete len:238 (-) Transcript_16508:96-809(-)